MPPAALLVVPAPTWSRWPVRRSAVCSASWHRTAYDIDAVQAAMRATALPASLASRLSVGQ